MSTTDTNVTLRHVEIPTSDGTCDARIATPNTGGRYAGVLFLMDAIGLRDVTDAWITRIAANGYVVLSPNLFYRSRRAPLADDYSILKNPDRRAEFFEQIRPMMQAVTPDVAMRDADAYISFLQGQLEMAPGPVGVTGYCFGGALAIRTAAAYPDRVAAAASFHGGNLATDAENSPHTLVDRIKGEVYVGHADNDQGATPEQQERLEHALAAAGVRHRTELYKDTPHGWTMSDTAAFREEAAERHFERLIDLLNRNLKPQG